VAGDPAHLARRADRFSRPAAGREHRGKRAPHRPLARAPRSRRRLLPVKVVAAGAVLCLGGIATAAYAGALPATAQRFAHDIAGGRDPADW